MPAPLPPNTPTCISPQGFAKTLSNEENLDSDEGGGLEFKELKLQEYVCPKLHRGDASRKASRSARCHHLQLKLWALGGRLLSR